MGVAQREIAGRAGVALFSNESINVLSDDPKDHVRVLVGNDQGMISDMNQSLQELQSAGRLDGVYLMLGGAYAVRLTLRELEQMIRLQQRIIDTQA
jgi:hypothetical protein